MHRIIVETEQLVEMLKQNGIAAFSQEAGANVAMHGAPGFWNIWCGYIRETDDAEKTVQLIKEINNQENEENFLTLSHMRANMIIEKVCCR